MKQDKEIEKLKQELSDIKIALKALLEYADELKRIVRVNDEELKLVKGVAEYAVLRATEKSPTRTASGKLAYTSKEENVT